MSGKVSSARRWKHRGLYVTHAKPELNTTVSSWAHTSTNTVFPHNLFPVRFVGTPTPSDANAEHELEESTAEVDRFVSEEAVVRIKFGGDGGDAGGGGGVNEAGAQEGAGAEAVPRLDEDHLRGVLKKVDWASSTVASRGQNKPLLFLVLPVFFLNKPMSRARSGWY